MRYWSTNVHQDYCQARRRVLFFGQETLGWDWSSNLQITYPAYPSAWKFSDVFSCNDFLANADSVEALCWAYGAFKFGAYQPGLSRTPFWRAFREVSSWSDTSLMWANVAKMDYSGEGGRSIWNAPEDLRDTLFLQQVTLVAEELEILQPDVCLFFSGPYYDDFIKIMLPDIKLMPCCDAPVRELARLSHPSLPAASFRTYHPAFLSRGDRWHYIEAIRSLV